MGIAHEAAVGIGRTLESVRAGTERLASRRLDVAPNAARLHVSSSLLRDGGALPRSAIREGQSAPPPLRWSGVPASAKSIVVICEDADAPLPEPFVHWMVYGVPATIQALDGTAAGHPEGLNSRLEVGYTGASPLAGHGVHHYHFQIFALDTMITLHEGAGRSALLESMRGHVVAWGEIVGTHEQT
jgi:Raf kinase inhibitor-like YbhB/YbcL family protein